jgi:hypothetical protein
MMLLLLSSCASSIVGTKAWYETYGDSSLRKRAGFEFSCPQEKIEATPLGAQGVEYKIMGVTGCDLKATYLWSSPEGWILNADSQRDSSAKH